MTKSREGVEVGRYIWLDGIPVDFAALQSQLLHEVLDGREDVRLDEILQEAIEVRGFGVTLDPGEQRQGAKTVSQCHHTP